MDLQLVEEDMNKSDICPTKIKVVGVGGGGGNIIGRIISSELKNIETIVINTDVQDLNKSKAQKKIQIGSNVTKGLGSGGVPSNGEKSAQENYDDIKASLDGADMVFITCGLGGGTGTGAAPIVAKAAKELGILSLAIVTTPFTFEGPKKRELANRGLEKLKKDVDSYIIIPNDNILKESQQNSSISDAFKRSDNVLLNAVAGVVDIIAKSGQMNVDFADIKSVLKDAGNVVLGIGIGKGEDKIVTAISEALNNPLLSSVSLQNSNKCVINITHYDEMKVDDLQKLMTGVQQSFKPDSDIKIGMVPDASLKDEIKLVIIAAGNRDISETQDSVKVETRKNLIEKSDSDIVDVGSWDRITNSDSSLIFNSNESSDIDVPAYLRRSR